MSQQVRTNQGGSVLSFIIVAVVLLGVVLGGIYLIRRATSPTQTTGDSSQEPSSDAPQSTPEEQKKPVTEPTPATPPTSNNGQAQTNTGNQSPQPTTTLPQTGPAETISTALILALVTGVLVSYGRSKRQLSSL